MPYSTRTTGLSASSTTALHAVNALRRSEVDVAVASLVARLRRLSGHKHDGTAIAAHQLLEEILAADTLTAQSYQHVYLRILRSRNASSSQAHAEWNEIHRTSCQVFERLLWVWRAKAAGGFSGLPAGGRPPLTSHASEPEAR
jgi:hypothetical protein